MDWQTEIWGGSRYVELTSDGYILPVPSGVPGACRFLELNPSDVPHLVFLPFGGYCRKGEHLTIWNSNGANWVVVLDQGLTVVAIVLAGQVGTFWLRDNSTAAGSWAVTLKSAAAGTSRTFDRIPLEHTITSDVYDFNLRSYCDAHGYDGSKPASVRLTIGKPSYQYIVGSTNTLTYAFDSGDWPAGSTLLIVNHALVSGRGGDGGPGGPKNQLVLMEALNGLPGGDAMRLRLDTAIVNYRKIQGGGGGGAGAAGDGNAAGGGGGGGAGHGPSVGGAAGSGGGAVQGLSGGAYGPGSGGGGAMSGAYGGDPGTGGNGSNSSPTFIGGAGGEAGRSIVRSSGVTVTKIVAGTIVGSEVAV